MASILRIPVLLTSLLLTAAGTAPFAPCVVTGRVVDERGRPVAGAEVRLREVRSLSLCSLDGCLTSTRTNADGTYRLVDPDPDPEHCVCCVDLYLDARSGTEQAMSGSVSRVTGPVHLRDLVLTEPFVLRGRVSDTEARSVYPAVVSMEAWGVGAGEEPGRPFSFDWDSQVCTSENGEYSFPPFPFRPGWNVRIRVETLDHVNLEMDLGISWDRPRVDLTVKRGVTVRGRALDPAGEPMAGLRVYCGDRRRETAEDGRFELRGIPLMGGRVYVSGHHTPTRMMIPPQDAEAIVELGDVVLRRGRAKHPEKPTILGTLLDAGGQPVAHTEVRAFRLADDEPRGRSWTTEDGHFGIRLGAPETCRVEASIPLTAGRLSGAWTLTTGADRAACRFSSRGVVRLEVAPRPPLGYEIEVVGFPRDAPYAIRRGLRLPAGRHRVRVIPLGGPTVEVSILVDPTAPARLIPVPMGPRDR